MTLSDKAYQSLTRKQKTIWRWAMREGQSVRRIANRLGIKPTSAYNRLNGAKKKYTRYFQENM